MNRQEGKVFVGGLSWETTDEKLRRYFENFGTVQEAFVSYDRNTGRPRGFGFVIFADAVVADKVVAQQHTIDRREVEAKKALPKDESPVSKDLQAAASGQRTKKIFVGGLAASVDEAAMRTYFDEFGAVEDAVVMYDHDNRRPRGFGFITFAEEAAVDAVFARGSVQTIHDKAIEIKRAVPRDAMPPSPRTVYRPPPHQQHYFHEGRSPYHGPPPPYRGHRGDRGGYGGSPYGGYSGGGRGRDGHGHGLGGRSPAPPHSGGGRGGGHYAPSPPVVVTGIPASMAGTPGATEAAIAPAMGTPGPSGMMGVGTPASPVAVTPGSMQSTPPPGLVSGFAMQNGMQGGGGGGGGASQFVGSPPFTAAGGDLQPALGAVTGALEQLQVSPQPKSGGGARQAPGAGSPGPAQQQAAQQAPQQSTTTTIWS